MLTYNRFPYYHLSFFSLHYPSPLLSVPIGILFILSLFFFSPSPVSFYVSITLFVHYIPTVLGKVSKVMFLNILIISFLFFSRCFPSFLFFLLVLFLLPSSVLSYNYHHLHHWRSQGFTTGGGQSDRAGEGVSPHGREIFETFYIETAFSHIKCHH